MAAFFSLWLLVIGVDTSGRTPRSVPCTAEEVLSELGWMTQHGQFSGADRVAVTLDDIAQVRGQASDITPEEEADFDRQMIEDVVKLLQRLRRRHKRLTFDKAVIGKMTQRDVVENIAPDATTIRDSEVLFKIRAGRVVRFKVSILVRVGSCWKVMSI